MKYGLSIISRSMSARPDVLAREIEARGFESFWFSDHSYIPVRPHKAHHSHPTGDTRPEFYDMYESLTAMALAAAATSTLKVGSSVLLLAERDPIWTAKTIATIDNLSNGRITIGVGAGWHTGEMANHRVKASERYAVLREHVLAVKAILSQETAEFHGKYVDFEEIKCLPRPIQRPAPKILGGFDGPNAIKSMIEWADGWMPSSATRPDIIETIAHIKQLVREADRDPSTFSISVNSGWQTAESDPALMDRLEAAGAERVIINLPSEDLDTLLPLLDKWAVLVER